jgi:hypothetical protein
MALPSFHSEEVDGGRNRLDVHGIFQALVSPTLTFFCLREHHPGAGLWGLPKTLVSKAGFPAPVRKLSRLMLPFCKRKHHWMLHFRAITGQAPVDHTKVEMLLVESLGKMSTKIWVCAGDVIVNKADAKADNAQIHTGLWNQQVILVLPWLTCNSLASS